MFTLSLFLGFLPDPQFQKELEKANPYLRSLFIGKTDYLEEAFYQGKRYLGKPLSAFPTVNQVEDMEKHLLSLLTKLVPNYLYKQNPPVLLTLCEK